MAGALKKLAGSLGIDSVVVRVHLANARKASKRWGVSVADILAILDYEGGTSPSGAPVAPGDGAGPPSYGQFTSGTGKSLGVKFGNSASETDAIGHYLVNLGYKRDRRRAIAAYNGGPGNPQYGYADGVIALSGKYQKALRELPPGVAGGGSGGGASLAGATAGADGGLFSSDERSGALKALVWVAFVLGGFSLAGMGLQRMMGGQAARGGS